MQYKYLSNKDRKRMNFQKKVLRNINRTMRWTFTVMALIIVFAFGTVAFYSIVDGKNEGCAMEDSSFDSRKQDTDFLVNKDKELEKTLECEQSISDAEHEREDAVNKSEMADFSQWNKTCPPELIIVNGNNAIPEGYNVDIKVCRGKEIGILAAEKLEEMIQCAAKEGIVLWISSGYRSVKYQGKLFDRQVQREMAKGNSQDKAEKLAQTVVARPGRSEHNTGLAVDFNGVRDDFYKTKEYKWLMDHAAEFGFIERYQEKWADKTGVVYEPWHFRYVGVGYAEKIKESNLCLESYVERV